MADPVDGQSPEEDGRPEWLPENFESPEALAKSYRELQGRFTQESQARAALEDNYAEIVSRLDEMTAAQAQPAQQQDPNLQAQYLAEQFGVEPEYLNAAAMIAQQAAMQAVQQATQQFQPQQQSQLQAQREIALRLAGDTLSATYPDWEQKVGKVQEVLEANPDFIREEDYLNIGRLADRIGSVYKQVSYDELVNGVSGDQAAGQPDVSALAARMKLNAQTATGASGRPDPVSDAAAAWDAIKNAKPTTYYS